MANVNDFDRDPFLVNFENGTFNVKTGKLRADRRDDRITKLVPFGYDPDAKAPTFKKFFRRILPDSEVRNFVQRALGYSLTGDIGKQVLFFLHGEGANGKSTFIETVMHVLGDYATLAPPGLLLSSFRDVAAWDLLPLQGAHFVSTQETSEDGRLNETLVKQLTGGDTLKAHACTGTRSLSLHPLTSCG